MAWECLYVDNFGDTVKVTLGATEYNDTCTNLAATYPTLFEIGESDNGDKALMFNVPPSQSTPVTGEVNGIEQVSTTCEIVGGRPKPPNK